ncbi:glutamate 5-kinase [Nigerium massiliense]|uniref:glutamate 5-kinase n=1 Tax=Nigerium massiliense TaxID=1522317 RepID=UPI000907733E|nr:glutamate 5-kinase [Nigerium massiliense]
MSQGARRPRVGGAGRVVVKVGSSSLTGPSGALDEAHLVALVDAIASVRGDGRDVVLVSSGAIAAGLAPLGMRRRPRDLASQQAAASVGQGILLERYSALFHERGLRVGQVLLTVDDVSRQANYANALRTFNRLLAWGIVPVVNENDTVATQEIRFGDNDRLAALVAHVVRADALVLLSDVDALYTAHPDSPGARRLGVVDDLDGLEVDTSRRGSAVGTGGMTTKLEAARIASQSGIDVVLTSADNVAPALAGQDVGTYFPASGKRRSRKLLWLAYASRTVGDVLLDAGAVHAVRHRNASLLAAGVTGVRGDFHAGDPVALVDEEGAVIARGLVNFDAGELARMVGRSTPELVRDFGPEYEREVVHRDSMVVRGPHRHTEKAAR